MLKTKFSLFLIFAIIIALTGTTGIFLAINMSKADKIVKEKIELNLRGETKVYDGLPLELSSISLDNPEALPNGYTYSFNCTDTITNVGIVYPNPTIIIYDKDGKNVTGYYDCVVKNNEGLEVTPRPLNISYNSARKAYDGTPLNETTYNLIDETSLVSGHKLSISYKSSATRIEQGPVDIKAVARIFDLSGIDVTDDYQIVDNLSGDDIPTFEIVGKKITISTKDKTKEYDGTPLALEVSDLIYEGLDGEDKIELIDPTKITKVGEIAVDLNETKIEIKNQETGLSVKDMYEIVFSRLGTLSVTKKVATIKLADINKTFDNKNHLSEEDEFIASGIIDGHKVQCDYDNVFRHAVTDADNTAKVKVFYVNPENNKKEDVTDCYNLYITNGKATIKPIEVNFSFDAVKAEEEYDITNITYAAMGTVVEIDSNKFPIDVNNFYTWDCEFLSITNEEIQAEGTYSYDKQRLTVSKTPGVEDGDIKYTVDSIILVVKKVEIEHTDPTPKENLVYNGLNQVLVNAGEINPLYGHIEYKVGSGEWSADIPSKKDVGTYEIEFKYVLEGSYAPIEGGSFNVTIAKKKVEYTLPKAIDNTYTGSALELITAGTIETDVEYTITYKLGDGEWNISIPKATDAKEYSVKYKFTITDTNYEEIEEGTITAEIKQAVADITLPVGNAALFYTGNDLELIIPGEINPSTIGTIKYRLEGSIWKDSVPTAKNAGVYVVHYRFILDENYKAIDDGMIEVTIDKKEVSLEVDLGISLNNKSVPYDGSYQTIVIEGNLPEGINVSYVGGGINVGDQIITATFTSNNYDFVSPTLTATLTITKREITIISESLEKVYDGSPLRTLTDSDGYALSSSYDVLGLPDLFYVRIQTFMDITDVGETYNFFDYDIYWKSNNMRLEAELNNFLVTPVEGTLTVTKKLMVFQSESLTKVYDGYALYSSSATLINGVEVAYIGSQTNVGTSSNVFEVVDTLALKNYEIVYNYGTLTVTPRNITVVTNSLTVESGDSLDDNDRYCSIVSGSDPLDELIFTPVAVTESGTQLNVFTVSNADNFNVSFIFGTITFK